ncbi:MAG: nucleotidyltransferase domain-containing protein [Methanosarcinales archaeon]|nr:nucleotidyltransferase domain-containing protein [Methanosarcinales archaeon]
MNRKEVAKRFSEEVLKRSGNEIVSMTLFGSVAEGTDTADSDIDILVITDANQNISSDIYDIVADFVIRYSELPSILAYSLNNMSEFAKKITQGGVVLYERDRGAFTKVQTLS